jgi:hypothetical protein
MVANLKYINYLLMGMTNLFAENLVLYDSHNNDKEKINDALGVIDVQDLVEEFN